MKAFVSHNVCPIEQLTFVIIYWNYVQCRLFVGLIEFALENISFINKMKSIFNAYVLRPLLC